MKNLDADKEALREKNRQKMARWRALNPEKAKAAYAKSNRKDGAQRMAAYRERNPEQVKISAKKSNARQRLRPEVLQREKERHLIYAREKPHKIREASARWRKAHPEYQPERRSLGRLSKGLTRRLYTSQKGRCPICLVDFKKTGFHIDHVQPIARGGPHIDSNIQLLCPTCNLRKAAKDPIDFMQQNGFLL